MIPINFTLLTLAEVYAQQNLIQVLYLIFFVTSSVIREGGQFPSFAMLVKWVKTGWRWYPLLPPADYVSAFGQSPYLCQRLAIDFAFGGIIIIRRIPTKNHYMKEYQKCGIWHKDLTQRVFELFYQCLSAKTLSTFSTSLTKPITWTVEYRIKNGLDLLHDKIQ